jgi:hypothetical protein
MAIGDGKTTSAARMPVRCLTSDTFFHLSRPVETFYFGPHLRLFGEFARWIPSVVMKDSVET